jgi:Type II secretion system (T2SS), protein M
MTGRDRMVLIGVVVLVILAAAWMLVVSPERQQASKLSAQVAEAQAQLTAAEGKVASARAAQSQYAAAYSAMVSLGKAVPPSPEVPSLIYQLTQASNEKSVDFNSIVNGGDGSSASASSTATTGVAAAGLTDEPFTFSFEGSFFDLEHLFRQLAGFATLNSSGTLQVSGRLLTIESVKLAPATVSAEPGKAAKANLSGVISASAYVMPASTAPTSASGATSTTSSAASSPSSDAPASSPTAPAVVRVNP